VERCAGAAPLKVPRLTLRTRTYGVIVARSAAASRPRPRNPSKRCLSTSRSRPVASFLFCRPSPAAHRPRTEPPAGVLAASAGPVYTQGRCRGRPRPLEADTHGRRPGVVVLWLSLIALVALLSAVWWPNTGTETANGPRLPWGLAEKRLALRLADDVLLASQALASRCRRGQCHRRAAQRCRWGRCQGPSASQTHAAEPGGTAP
jgi:hypothetical protein